MVFSSFEFLFLYLPISLILYFSAPSGYKNLILFLVSLVFYGFEKPIYVLIMLFVIVVGYAFGYLVARANDGKKRKQMLVLGVAINIATLGFFKYTDFLIGLLSKIPIFDFLEPMGVELPIGISFYVFQSTSYVVDIYRRESMPQRNFVNFGAYVSMFPQLIAGPIVRYSDVDRELNERTHTFSESADGVRRFVVGLAKKVLLADASGEMWEYINEIPREQTSVLLLWLGIIFYAFQIYFDFSGYSDMGIGLGKLLGFHFPENFNYPYVSKSITEFWRRWHITLSTWFREYVYVPLGGNRRGRGRLVLNLLAVWLLTGLWHGASLNFVLWGFYYFLIITAEKLFLSKWLKKLPSVALHVYTMLFVLIGWLIFYFKEDAGGFGAFSSYFCGMLGFSGLPLANGELAYVFVTSLSLLTVLCMACTPYPKNVFNKLKEKRANFSFAFDILLVLVFVICIIYIASSEYRPNIYFEF